jgi:hypothetical protein
MMYLMVIRLVAIMMHGRLIYGVARLVRAQLALQKVVVCAVRVRVQLAVQDVQSFV